MKPRLVVLLALGAIATAVPVALAEPAHKGKVTADAPAYKWQGATGVSGNVATPAGSVQSCGDPTYTCEDALVDVALAGDLNIKIVSDTPGEADPFGFAAYPDFDAYLYKSNAAGEVPEDAEPIAFSAEVAADEEFTAKGLQAGFYIVQVRYYAALEDSYNGTVTLSNFVVEPPAPPAAAEAPAASEPPPAEQQQQAPPPPPPPPPPPVNGDPPAQQQTSAPASRAATAKRRKAALKRCRTKARKKRNVSKRKAALRRCARKYS